MSTSEPAKTDESAQARVHAGHDPARRQIMAKLITQRDTEEEALPMSQSSSLRPLIGKLHNCGRYPTLYQNPDTGQMIMSRALCRSRICPTCGAIRAQRLRRDILPLIKAMDAARLITLTLKGSDAPLAEQIKRLQTSWRKLRQRKAAKPYLKGGLYVIEVTYNPASDQWHPHLHIVADGAYWPQRELSDLWRSITTDSAIVDIRAIHERSAVAAYVAKYVSKCHTPRDACPARTAEWCRAVHGLRMVQTFGDMHARQLGAKPSQDRSALAYVAPLNPLYDAAARGDGDAAHLLGLVEQLGKLRDPFEPGEADPAAFDADVEVCEMVAAWWERRQLIEQGKDPDPIEPDEPPPIQQAPLPWE